MYKRPTFPNISCSVKRSLNVTLNTDTHGCNAPINLLTCAQLQEFRTGATRQAMETTKSKEDCKDLRNDVTDLRDKINDLDNRVRLLLIVFITTTAHIIHRVSRKLHIHLYHSGGVNNNK